MIVGHHQCKWTGITTSRDTNKDFLEGRDFDGILGLGFPENSKVADQLRIKSVKDQSITQIWKAPNPTKNDELVLKENGIESKRGGKLSRNFSEHENCENQSTITEFHSALNWNQLRISLSYALILKWSALWHRVALNFNMFSRFVTSDIGFWAIWWFTMIPNDMK